MLVPWMVPPVVNGFLWGWLLNSDYGAFNGLLYQLGIIHEYQAWLVDPRSQIIWIAIVQTWTRFSFPTLVLLAGLQGIPGDLYEAARIDGASAFAQFRHITLPMLKPTMLMVSILTVSGYFQLFAEPYVMTEGGPLQSTTSVLYLMYEEGFKWWNLGSASAVAFILFVIMFAVTATMLRLSRQGEKA